MTSEGPFQPKLFYDSSLMMFTMLKNSIATLLTLFVTSMKDYIKDS